MTTDRPLCALIGALGGQGGGVLADWLVEASYNAGYPAQATSTLPMRSEPVQLHIILNCSRRRTCRWTQFSRCSRQLEIWTLWQHWNQPSRPSSGTGIVTETTTVITGLIGYIQQQKMSAGDGTIDDKPMGSLRKGCKGCDLFGCE